MMKHLIYIAMLLVGFTGCKKPEDRACFKKIGETVLQERVIAPFQTLVIDANLDVVLKQDSFFRVEVESGENLVNRIKTVIDGETLTISDENKCRWFRKLDHKTVIYVTAPSFPTILNQSTGDIWSESKITQDKIRYEGSMSVGDITLDLAVDSAAFFVETGPSDLILSGSANYTFLYHSGSGFGRCQAFEVQKLHVNSFSTGDFFVKANASLNAELNGRGDIIYSGNPATILTGGTGTGTLLEAN